MSYPNDIDSDIPEIADGVTPLSGSTINALRDSSLSIERELGQNPSGTYGTVADRIERLSSPSLTINASDVSILDVDGYFAATSMETAFAETIVRTEPLKIRSISNAIDIVQDKDYGFFLPGVESGTVSKLSIETASGTCDATLYIDSAPLTTANVTSTREILTFSVGNSFNSSNSLFLRVANNSTAEMLTYTIVYVQL